MPDDLAAISCTSSSGATVIAPPAADSPSGGDKVTIQVYDNGTHNGQNGSIFSWIGMGGAERGRLLLNMEIDLRKMKYIGNMQRLYVPDIYKNLPLNTLIMATENGLYVTEEVDQIIKDKVPQSSSYQQVEPIESRDEEDTERKSSLISEIKSSEILLNERRTIVEQKLKSVHNSNELNVQRSEKSAILKRYETELKRINYEYEIEKASEGNDVKLLRKFVDIKDSLERREQVRKDIEEVKKRCEKKKEENLKIKFLFELRQLKLISDVQGIYPIEKSETTGEYCIRGLELPSEMSSIDDDHVASALGYVAHLLILLSKYLEIPLRYPIAYAASKSLIRDPLLIPTGGGVAATLPLYRKGVDKEKFERAVTLIRKNVQQLVYSVGIEYQHDKNWLENLNLIFQNQIWPIMGEESSL